MTKYFGEEEGEVLSYSVELKRMADYCRLSFDEVRSLPLSYYLLIKRDSWIHALRQTEKGREILKDLWRLQQTKADMKKIREHKEHKKKEGGEHV